MNGPMIIVMFGGLIGIYFVGQGLIDTYFARKEQFVDNIQEKMKGSFDGTDE